MKKTLFFLITLLTLFACTTAMALTPELTLRPSDDEVKVYAIPSMKAGIVGYIIVGGRQEVNVLALQGDWVQVSFTTVSGLREGWIPRSCFMAAATPSPAPTAPPPVTNAAFVCNPQQGYRLNLRGAPSNTAVSLGKYYTGTPVTLTGQRSNGFAQVKIGSVQGWMDERYLTTDGWSFLNELPQVTVSNRGSGANLRAGTSTASQILGWYPHGASVTILGVRSDEWYHVVISGQTGYMSASLLSRTYPWHTGVDSDAPTVSGNITAGSQRYIYGAAGAHLRTSASDASRSLGVFYSGCPVTIVSYTRTGWAYVSIGELAGYIDAGSLASTRPNRTGEARTIINHYGSGLNLRTLPTLDSAVLALRPNYSTVTVLGDLAGDWCFVLADGQYGYMMGTRLVP